MRRIRHRAFLTILGAILSLSFVLPAVAQPRRDRRQPPSGRPSRETERETKIRKAREEIRKTPAQKKFILFRYGLKDEDLR